MKVDRTPFTTFDFIGYFIPGFLFLYILYLTFDFDFHSILTLDDKRNQSYEYVVFSVFIFIFAWFVGHLLSWVSQFLQIFANNIFKNTCNKCVCWIFNPFSQGTKSVFAELNQPAYESLLGSIFKKMVAKKGLPSTSIKKVNVPLFLKCTSYYMKTDKFSIIYNYLVIQGAFRAFTLSFLIHLTLLLLGMFYDIRLECWVTEHFLNIFIGELITAYICWNIYIKYYRRQIEENVVYLIHELYLNKDSK